MPFTGTRHQKGGATIEIVPDQWKHIYEEWIKKAVESFPDRKIVCKRSTATPGNFIKGIVQDLNDSHLVVADLTGNRPNVYYELGIRNALRTGTVLITQDLKALPSDLQTYYCFQYNYSEKAHEYGKAYIAFEAEMHEKLGAIVSENFPSDNPVSDFLGFSHYQQRREFLGAKNRLTVALNYFYTTALHVEQFFAGVSRTEFTSPDDIWHFLGILDTEMLTAVLSRIKFDFDRSMFPKALMAHIDNAIQTMYPHLLRMRLRASQYDVRSGSLYKYEASEGLKVINTKTLETLLKDLAQLREPVSA